MGATFERQCCAPSHCDAVTFQYVASGLSPFGVIRARLLKKKTPCARLGSCRRAWASHRARLQRLQRGSPVGSHVVASDRAYGSAFGLAAMVI